MTNSIATWQDTFFKPVSSNMIENLIMKRDAKKRCIEEVYSYLKEIEESNPVYSYFTKGYHHKRGGYIGSMTDLFSPVSAIAALDAEAWDEALSMIEAFDYMPTKKRDQWKSQIHEHNSPEFIKSNVALTLRMIIDGRAHSLAEMVDGIFEGLSREHVTNRPEAFYSRMIFEGVHSY